MSHLEPEAKIFACSQSVYLAEKYKEYGIPLGKLPCQNSDGEFQPSDEESIRGYAFLLFAPLFPTADNLMELLL
jgi:ribose-phosphate pyrophosphokinase